MPTAHETAPYLSVVVTARNDDHGGNLLGRMQVFIDAWIGQSNRHHLPSELILVEWNPPPQRERLVSALRWPRDMGVCQVRVIEVPPEVHARYCHAAVLPLYQMIAKNAGIRRAHGEFILATNIDIVFSDELMQFLAARVLKKGRMYRIDRTDVMSDVPVDGTLDEQLAYCRNHLIRVFAREGAFPLTAAALRQNEPEDIAGPDSGIYFGEGWFPVERYRPTEPFRWIGSEAEVSAVAPPGGAVLELELESGPGIDRSPAHLQIFDSSGAKVADLHVTGRNRFGLVISPRHDREPQTFRLRVLNGGLPVTNDHRILNFRVFRCDWAQPKVPQGTVPLPIQEIRPALGRMLAGWRGAHGVMSALIRGPGICRHAIRLLRARGEDIFEGGCEVWPGPGWHQLEKPGIERFRWVAQGGQLTVRNLPGSRGVGMLVEPGPALGFQPFVLVIRTPGGKLVARAPVQGLTYVEFPAPVAAGTITTLVFRAEGGRETAEGGGEPSGRDARDLRFRVLALGSGEAQALTQPDVPSSDSEPWAILELGSKPAEIDWSGDAARLREISAMGRPEFLHTNACGDFTLMAREHWFDVRGYAELDQFSMHLDSLLCYAAHYAGALEEMLHAPQCIYHIEHGLGSGWTPEGQERLNTRIALAGIQSVTYPDVVWFISQMRKLRAPLIFNLEDWGLAALELSEIQPGTAEYVSRSGR